MTRKNQRQNEVVISDPRTIRALAHPARLAVLAALLGGQELTATQCSEMVGLTPSAMSYHLRALYRWGLIEHSATAASGRERPWRARGSSLRVESANSRTTEAAEQALLQRMMEADQRALTEYLASQAGDDKAWRDTLFVARSQLSLTVAEVQELQRRITTLIQRYQARSEGRSPLASARQVRVSLMVVPSAQSVGSAAPNRAGVSHASPRRSASGRSPTL